MSKAIQFRNRNNEPIYPCPYFPVGSIYISVSSTNPTTWFGGTWEQIKGRFLLGVGSPSDNSDNYFGTIGNKSYSAGVGSTGGQSNHTLTINEMPSHNHNAVSTSGSNGGVSLYPFSMIQSNYNLVDQNVIRPAGGNQAHNNMPPYFAVYMWKRVS